MPLADAPDNRHYLIREYQSLELSLTQSPVMRPLADLGDGQRGGVGMSCIDEHIVLVGHDDGRHISAK